MKAILAIAAVAGILARVVAGRPHTTGVTYDVEFETKGPWETKGCPAVGGSDKLTGTITGDEPFPVNRSNKYHGLHLKRVTNVEYCTYRTLPSGEGADCLISIRGSGYFKVELEVQDARVGYFKAIQAGGPLVSTVSGNCDPAEMAQLKRDYGSGETAGSPGGQPITMAVRDSIRVKTYPPNLAEASWTLKVLHRH